MFATLSKLFAGWTGQANNPHRFRPGCESLEGRQLMSATPLTLPPAAVATTVRLSTQAPTSKDGITDNIIAAVMNGAPANVDKVREAASRTSGLAIKGCLGDARPGDTSAIIVRLKSGSDAAGGVDKLDQVPRSLVVAMVGATLPTDLYTREAAARFASSEAVRGCLGDCPRYVPAPAGTTASPHPLTRTVTTTSPYPLTRAAATSVPTEQLAARGCLGDARFVGNPDI